MTRANTVKQINVNEAAALLASGGVDIVDVRDPRDWASGHVPGARSVAPHSYVNTNKNPCWMYLVMTYARGHDS